LKGSRGGLETRIRLTFPKEDLPGSSDLLISARGRSAGRRVLRDLDSLEEPNLLSVCLGIGGDELIMRRGHLSGGKRGRGVGETKSWLAK